MSRVAKIGDLYSKDAPGGAQKVLLVPWPSGFLIVYIFGAKCTKENNGRWGFLFGICVQK